MDLRLALRSLGRAPIFTLTTFASLVFGLALAVSTVSVLNAYLIRSLPYEAADRLYHVMYAPPGPWEPRGMTALDWTSVNDVVEHAIAAASDTFNLSGDGYASAPRLLRVTPGFIDGLGVRAAVGRTLTTQDFSVGAPPVALIGQALWRDRFGADPGAIGRTIRGEADLRGGVPESFQIVGVLPPGFYFGRDSTMTIDVLAPQASPIRTYMVRLRRGVTQAAAERRITEAARVAATSPIPADWPGVKLESAYERYVGSVRPIILGVTGAVILVLVIVSANVAVLVLLRATERRKEIGIRLAMGCSRRGLAQLLLVESGLLVAAALATAIVVTRAVLTQASASIEAELGRPSPHAHGIGVDLNVVAIAAAIGVAIVLLVSLAPLFAWGRRLMDTVRQDTRTASDGPAMRRARQGLIVLEVAGSLILLVSCGLMIRSAMTMAATELGFDPYGIGRSRVMLPSKNYADAAAFNRFHDQFAARASERIGSPVVYSSWPPFAEAPSRRIEADGAAANAGMIAVTPGYFAAFEISIRAGRPFDKTDLTSDTAIVSEMLARRLWPAGDAIGRRVRLIDHTPTGLVPGPWRSVVGVAADVRQAYDDTDVGDFYTAKIPDGRYGTFYVRTAKPTQQLFADLREAAAAIDPDAVINEPHRLSDDNQALARTRFLMGLLAVFAATAAMLAIVGVYGVTAYAVRQQRKEIAIRVAVGAAPGAIVSLFLWRGAAVIGTGAVAGLAGGAAVSRVLEHHIFGLRSADPAPFAIAAALLVGCGAAAMWWPARRAARTAPIEALTES